MPSPFVFKIKRVVSSLILSDGQTFESSSTFCAHTSTWSVAGSKVGINDVRLLGTKELSLVPDAVEPAVPPPLVSGIASHCLSNTNRPPLETKLINCFVLRYQCKTDSVPAIKTRTTTRFATSSRCCTQEANGRSKGKWWPTTKLMQSHCSMKVPDFMIAMAKTLPTRPPFGLKSLSLGVCG